MSQPRFEIRRFSFESDDTSSMISFEMRDVAHNDPTWIEVEGSGRVAPEAAFGAVVTALVLLDANCYFGPHHYISVDWDMGASLERLTAKNLVIDLLRQWDGTMSYC